MGTQYEIQSRLIDVNIEFFNAIFNNKWYREGKAKECADVISSAVHSASDTGNDDYLDVLSVEIVRQLREKDCDDVLSRIKKLLTEEEK